MILVPLACVYYVLELSKISSNLDSTNCIIRLSQTVLAHNLGLITLVLDNGHTKTIVYSKRKQTRRCMLFIWCDEILHLKYCKSTNFGVLLYLANCIFSLIFAAANIRK